MKNYSEVPLFAIAVVIVLLVVGDSLAQSNRRSSRSGSSTRPSARDASSTRNGSSTRARGSSSRSRQNREALDVEDTEEPLSPQAQAAINEMMVIRNKIADNRKRIDQLFREMPIGFDNAQMEKQKQIDVAKEQGKVLKRQMTEQGIKVFRLAPMRERISSNIVVAKLSDSLAPATPDSKFDPKTAMEISKLILDQERLPWQILMKAFKACYANHEFEQASLILDRLEEFGPVKDSYYEVLEETSQAWQDELLIRRLETATGDLPYAVVETSEGKFIIELFENQATLTVYDFIARAESGFYDGLPFHWVRPAKFARVGWSRETRGPANDTISSEAQKEKARKHFAGSVSMVSADGQTTSSVFQICHQPNLDFNGQHTVFGRVVDFKETVEGETTPEDALEIVYRLKTVDANRFNVNLAEASKIIKVTIKNKRAHDYKPSTSTTLAKPSSAKATPVIQTGGRVDESSSFDLLPQGGTQN
jgi:cyclophilin family peptidyl-prolyl cis-trans isomerase